MIHHVGRKAYVYAVNGAYDDETYDSLPAPIEFDPVSDTKVEMTGAANMIATELVGEANAACSEGQVMPVAAGRIVKPNQLVKPSTVNIDRLEDAIRVNNTFKPVSKMANPPSSPVQPIASPLASDIDQGEPMEVDVQVLPGTEQQLLHLSIERSFPDR